MLQQGSKPWLFDGDLTKVTWARASNSKAQITKAIYDAHVHMIEVDISMGHPVGQPTAPLRPMILHPPEKNSDIDVHEFFNSVVPLVEGIDVPKGFKLDFKCKEAFTSTLPDIQKCFQTRKKQFPIWLNADILAGPGARSATPVDPDYFIVECAKFPQVVISVGWITMTDPEELGYQEIDIDHMLEILKKYKMPQPITISVKATMLEHSYDRIIRLMKGVKEDSTLTLWCYQTDRPNIDTLKKILKQLGRNRIYLDVPSFLLDEIGSPLSTKGHVRPNKTLSVNQGRKGSKEN